MRRRLHHTLDDLLGEGLERGVMAHHRRRLGRVGWAHALDPTSTSNWVAHEPPPRDGNHVEVLIDGEAATGAIARAIAGATSSVEIAGWFVSPYFAMPIGERGTGADGATAASPKSHVALRDLLAEAAERVDVRVLLWAGFPLRGYAASRHKVREAVRELCAGTRIRCAIDGHERPLHCHHEKLVVVDEQVAFVGGIDLTNLGGRREDSPEHAPRGTINWHDVATRCEGPIVADVARHVRMRWTEVTGENLAEPKVSAPCGAHSVQLIRTVPEKVYQRVARGDFSVLQTYVTRLCAAQRFIYIENQFLWSPEISRVLCELLRNPPTDDFRVLVVLPAKPQSGGDDTRGQLTQLREADAGNQRLLACCMYSHSADGEPDRSAAEPQASSEMIYVHAKVCVIDDAWLTIGSANLNEHSLFNDTEVNIALHDEQLARDTRERLWAEHLELPLDQVAGVDPVRLIDETWRPIADAQAARRRRGERHSHRLCLLESSSSRSERLLGPVQGLLVDG